MRIETQEQDGRIIGYQLELSADETFRWANRLGKVWPCSTLSGASLRVDVNGNGLCDLSIDGNQRDSDVHELVAIVADHLPTDCQHLWPTWSNA